MSAPSLFLALNTLQNSCWFDLSPRNVEGKIATRKDADKIVHMTFAVAKQFAPSVIYIDEAHKYFPAGKPKKGG